MLMRLRTIGEILPPDYPEPIDDFWAREEVCSIIDHSFSPREIEYRICSFACPFQRECLAVYMIHIWHELEMAHDERAVYCDADGCWLICWPDMEERMACIIRRAIDEETELEQQPDLCTYTPAPTPATHAPTTHNFRFCAHTCTSQQRQEVNQRLRACQTTSERIGTLRSLSEEGLIDIRYARRRDIYQELSDHYGLSITERGFNKAMSAAGLYRVM